MSAYAHNNDTVDHPPQDVTSSPTRAYFPSSKTASITPTLSAAFSEKLATTLASKKPYINLPSIQKVITSHSSKKAGQDSAPDYDETIANIPDLDLLPPPPVYDIVNCPTSQTLLLVSSLINTILAVNDRLACPKITLFHSRAIPNISIEAYLSRILQYAPFQNEVLLIILLYFDRIGGGCKPTQVLTNAIPKSLLRQASLTAEDINQLTAPKTENPRNEVRRRDEKSEFSRFSQEASSAEDEMDNMDEEEPIADEIYTSSSESPVGSKLIINSFNIHRLLITSILVASKFSSDVFYPNVRYARVGGLPLSELNQLELEFLFLSQFELNTTEPELQTYGNKLLMYHQRLNGTERASIDAITPAKGGYVRLSEKKHIVHDSRPMPPKIQTAVQSQQRPPSESESRAFVSVGPYRDSKEIIDDDEVMSEKAVDQVGSLTDWRRGQSTPVIGAETTIAKYPTRRSNKMNLDHMVWPTNEMDIKYAPSTYYGGMIKDEDAARIEEEFNKASPPPEASEPNPKRKLQRLSSSTMEPVPAKRINTPSKNSDAEKPNAASGSNKNILKPLLRKIASFASHRSETIPAPEPEPTPPTLRSHPYLIRHKISPASSSANLTDSEDAMSPATPTSRAMSWQQDEYSSSGQGHMRAPPAFQMKPPPPPYSGQDQEHDHDKHLRSMSHIVSYKSAGSTSRGRRQHRSREPSLSSLASELTFEPTRSSLSPMREELSHGDSGSAHPATLAPFYFPPEPQALQGPRTVQQYPSSFATDANQDYSTPPTTPMTREDRSASNAQSFRIHNPFESPSLSSQAIASPSSEADDHAMQCDEHPVSPPAVANSWQFHSEPLAVSESLSGQEKYKPRASERIETEGLDAGASSSVSSPSTSSNSQRATESDATAGRQWTPRHAPAPTHPPAQYPHPHYIASYYPAPNAQLFQEPVAIPTVGSRSGVVAIPRIPQTLPGTSTTSSSRQSLVPVTPRQTRQFAPIRPRTPMTVEEDSKGHAVQPTTESTQKKKRGSTAEPNARPLMTTAVAAPPPYCPPFIAYPTPYAHLRAPDGSTVRPPAPMLMAVDYSHGALAAAGHAPQFIAAGPPGMGPHAHPGAPTRLFIPVIPVMYNKPPHQLVSATPLSSGKASGKTNMPAKIAPRLNRPS
ncbi:hypothetical protein BGZ54_001114 [Gamsiella multidivaricata]|nr:hypothetical protein BGZ54_001114 [Gamsiella multidivaricata]